MHHDRRPGGGRQRRPSVLAQDTHVKIYGGAAYVGFNDWFGVELDDVNATPSVNFSPLTVTFAVVVVHAKIVAFDLGPS